MNSHTQLLRRGTRYLAPVLALGLIGSSMAAVSCNGPRPQNQEPSTAAPDTGFPSTGGFRALLGENASLQGFRPFPDDHAWNLDITDLPVDPESDTLISSMGPEETLKGFFGTYREGAPHGIPYVVVSGEQARIPVSFTYASESDPGPYPIPPGAPIEGGSESAGDRRVIVLDRDHLKLYELYDAHPVGDSWRASSGAVFDLRTGARLSPPGVSSELAESGRTSADAAGLSVFAGLARYDEVVEAGEIRHALRFTTQHTRAAYVAPATHFSGESTDPRLPPMGLRVRLKADYDISWASPVAQTLLRALKKYGMILADHGADWGLSGAPDPRWPEADLMDLKQVPGSAFEVVARTAIER
jgi:hypothetical protein